MLPERRKLPNRREHVTAKVVLFEGTSEERRFHMSFGVDARAARVGDIWIDGPKAGSHEQAALHDAAAVVSVALQHGVPVAVLAAACDMPEGAPRSALAAALKRAEAIEEEFTRQ